jgi:histidinol-phosphate aminotransferase
LESALDRIKALNPYTPGKPVEELERELGIRDSIKLASNENPLGCSRKVIQTLQDQMHQIALYPDANGYYLKHALSQQLKIGPEQITLGNGSNDVLDLIARTFLDSGREAVYSEYGFLIYPLVTQACGAKGIEVPALPRDAGQPYGHDLSAMLSAITDKTTVIFIANPNNPTGTWVASDELYHFIEVVPQHIVVVIDEAYFEYVEEPDYPDSQLWLDQFPNLIVTRTFSKIYGLAGLRLGYSMSSPAIADLLNRVRQPFNGNAFALAAALESLQDVDFVQDSKENNRQGLARLQDYCERKGLFYIPSAGNFLTVEFGTSAMEIYQQLLHKGVIVRPVANYRLADFLRITIGTDSQMQRLMGALDELL